MRTGSVCTGYGGLDQAVHEVLGGELAWLADNDEGAAKILAHRFPGVPNLGDITKTDWSAIEPVDVLTAGFPCQDISYAGRREGIREGNRSGLWYTIADTIGVLQPSLVVLENVAAIVGRRPGLDVVLGSLAALGFDAEWLCVRASDAGAPHGRNRLFLIARPAADPQCDRLERRRATTRTGAGRAPAASIGCRPSDSGPTAENPDRAAGGEWRLAAPGQAAGWRPRADAGRPGGAPTAADASREGLEVRSVEPHRHERPAAQRGRGDAPADPAGGGRDDRDDGSDAGAAGERGTLAGNARGSDSAPVWRQYEPVIRRWEAILGRAAPRPTEPGRTGERLSPAFVEWMQGLPAGWVTAIPGLSRKDQLHALGNGVVPAQAAMALRMLLDRADIAPLVAAEEVA